MSESNRRGLDGERGAACVLERAVGGSLGEVGGRGGVAAALSADLSAARRLHGGSIPYSGEINRRSLDGEPDAACVLERAVGGSLGEVGGRGEIAAALSADLGHSRGREGVEISRYEGVDEFRVISSAAARTDCGESHGIAYLVAGSGSGHSNRSQ